MRKTVSFREYELPTVNPETGEEERGEYTGSFNREFHGTVAEINDQIEAFLKEHAEREKVDVRVWQGQ